MSLPTRRSARIKNQILSALPRAEYEQVLPALERIRLVRGTVLYNAGDTVRHAYFVTGGMVSVLSTTEDGKTVEVGMIGDEGLIGVPIILGMDTAPYRTAVQLPATACRIRAAALRGEFSRGGKLQNMLLRYTHTLISQLSQSAVCNRFHTAEERLCRWLLTSRDRVRSNTIHFTQETISQMLGVPRTGVTLTASTLQRCGLISYSRGKIEIIDVRGLEAAACECYGIVRKEFEDFMAA